MKRNIQINEEQIFNSIDGIQSVAVPPFFYTRLIARMQLELVEKREQNFMFKPAFLSITLSVILIFNIIFLYNSWTRHNPSLKQMNNSATIDSFADAYDLNTTSVYE